MNNPNMFPMQPMAEQMAQQGRYGDSMMVHMNPIEVAGIASLSPTGQLTTNPMTGQPEAFLPFLAPLLGSVFGGAITGGLATLPGLGFLGGLSAPVASAVGSGLATTAVTGDLKEGLVSGLTGFGIGKALGAAKDVVGGVTEATKAATAAEQALAKGTEAATEQAVKAGTAIPTAATNDALLQLSEQAGQAQLNLANTAPASTLDTLTSTEGLKAAGKGLLTPGAAVPIAVGEGQRAAMAAQDERDRMFGRRAAEKEQDRQDAQSIVDASIRQAGSDYGIDYSKEYGRDYGMMGGGITSVNPDDFQRRHAELQMMGRQPVQMDGGGRIRDINLSNVGVVGGFGAPAGRQSRLRGPVTIKPEELVGTRPGFQPEISYFRQPTEVESSDALKNINVGKPNVGIPGAGMDIDPALYQGIGAVGKGGGMGGTSVGPLRGDAFENYFNRPQIVRDAQETIAAKAPKKGASKKRIEAQKIVDAYDAGEYGDYYDDITENVYGMQEGGDTTGQMDQSMAMQLIEQVSMALLGRLPEEQAEVVINRFIDEFGSEAFQMLRSQVLESVVPNSQKEGVIQGEGKGMDDQVPGMIGDQQPVAVSPGEFIVPADVVSGIGDGDTNSGVQELEGMMDRVRQDRTGTMKQPAPLGAKAGGALPA